MFFSRLLASIGLLILSGGFLLSSSNYSFGVYRVSVTSTGDETDLDSFESAISGDGSTAVFYSWSRNIVPGDTNNSIDLFLHDFMTGEVKRISGIKGAQPVATQSSPWGVSISYDGAFVAFPSYADNLISNDTNGTTDIYVFDQIDNSYERVSVSSANQQANSWSYGPSISADGRFVAFASLASNLVPGDYNNNMDIFVRDRLLNQTQLVTVPMEGGYVWGQVDSPSISADGRFVAFASFYAGFVPGDTNSCTDVFIRDLSLGVTKRVSLNSVGIQGNSDSYQPSISGDGRYVAFASKASNLVLGDDSTWDIFVHDNETGQTILVSKSTQGVKGNKESGNPKISLDGRFVVFQSTAINLVADDTNNYCGTNYLENCRDVFLHDLMTGETRRVSVSASGEDVNGYSGYPSISADGTVIVFESSGFNIVGIDENYHSDIYLYAWHPDMNVFLPYIQR
ncbi:MAG: hypothetical protein PHQ40_10050 [Anaerolineaceae bacterium]|nr:hypothetical protein [Anaerolineaceae bacterium]